MKISWRNVKFCMQETLYHLISYTRNFCGKLLLKFVSFSTVTFTDFRIEISKCNRYKKVPKILSRKVIKAFTRLPVEGK